MRIVASSSLPKLRQFSAFLSCFQKPELRIRRLLKFSQQPMIENSLVSSRISSGDCIYVEQTRQHVTNYTVSTSTNHKKNNDNSKTQHATAW